MLYFLIVCGLIFIAILFLRRKKQITYTEELACLKKRSQEWQKTENYRELIEAYKEKL